MIFELREYEIYEGQMENWLKLMQEQIHPFQAKLGVVLIASFTTPEDPNKYVWIRRFASPEERERLYQAIYESEYWLGTIKPQIELVLNHDTIKVTLLEANWFSPVS